MRWADTCGILTGRRSTGGRKKKAMIMMCKFQKKTLWKGSGASANLRTAKAGVLVPTAYIVLP